MNFRRLPLAWLGAMLSIMAQADELPEVFLAKETDTTSVSRIGTGNGAEEITSELNEVKVRKRLLPQVPVDDANFSFFVLIAGKDAGYQMWIAFHKGGKTDPAGIAKALNQYTAARWNGVSKEGAFKIVDAASKPNENGHLQQRLSNRVPWLSAGALRPLKPDELASFPGLGKKGDFVFEDSGMAYIVSEIGEDALDTFRIDPTELKAAHRDAFHTVKAVALKQVELRAPGRPKSLNAFWTAMKAELKKQNIEWQSPGDLNPMESH